MDDPEEKGESSPMDHKVNKRRSLVFQRQSIGHNEQDLENTVVTEETSGESKRPKLQSVSKSFDIEKYIETLKEEDKKWHDVYATRKSRVQDLTKRDRIHEQALDLSCLSDSERAFLKARPDYEEFNKNVFQLHALATKVSVLNTIADNFCEKSAEKLKNDTDALRSRVIKLSESE